MGDLPAVRAHAIERGDLIPRDRIDAVLALLGIRDPGSVAALSIDQVDARAGEWAGQITIIRRTTYRQRITGPGLNGPARFVEHHQERRTHIPITPEDT